LNCLIIFSFHHQPKYLIENILYLNLDTFELIKLKLTTYFHVPTVLFAAFGSTNHTATVARMLVRVVPFVTLTSPL